MANFYGNNYNNTQYGTGYADNMYGYGGNDSQYGNGGNDYMIAGDGNDYQNGGLGNDALNGGNGVDTLYGGRGADYLVGGYDTSTDYFRFSMGDSPASTGYADSIADWNVSHDYIDMPIAGNYGNYAEAWTSATSISSARAQVEASWSLRQEDHVFLYNPNTDTGYLLSDLNYDSSFETGVILRGAGSQYDLSYSDII